MTVTACKMCVDIKCPGYRLRDSPWEAYGMGRLPLTTTRYKCRANGDHSSSLASHQTITAWRAETFTHIPPPAFGVRGYRYPITTNRYVVISTT